jgi:hypothetical protein
LLARGSRPARGLLAPLARLDDRVVLFLGEKRPDVIPETCFCSAIFG